MADFKEQTNSLMVRVIPIYLAAELLCLKSIRGGGRINASRGEVRQTGAGLHLSCEAVRGVCVCVLRGLFDSCPAEQQRRGGGL